VYEVLRVGLRVPKPRNKLLEAGFLQAVGVCFAPSKSNQSSRESGVETTMTKATFSQHIFRSAIALTTVFGATAILSAQTTAQPTSTVPAAQVISQVPALDTSKDAVFSSSATENADSPVAEASLVPMTPNFAEMMQYGGRARGGRPRYRGANTNPDGSNKWTALAGFGFQQPVGNTWHYYTPSWGLQVGFGRQWSKHFALPIQFDYDHAGLTGATLTNQINLYNQDINYYCGLPANQQACLADGVSDYTNLDGNMHTWSFTINPTETLYQSNTWGAYAVEGVGFYHKVTNFVAPEEEEYCDPYYGICEPIEANAVIDHYTSNAPGFSAGLGLTYKFSRFSNERFYGEIRYVFVDNSYRPGVTVSSNVASTYQEANDFPANSNHTTYFPVKFGIRF